MNILVIGGTRYFGRRYVEILLKEGHTVTLLTRGQTDDGFGNSVKRLTADRRDSSELCQVIGDQIFDVVVDQICMEGKEALEATKIFNDKTKYYIMTSTMAVYPELGNVKEEDFPPESFDKNSQGTYQNGKRAAEKTYHEHLACPVSFARFPIVLGVDDYTFRLRNQVLRIQEEKPLYFPSLDHKFGYITSEDAAKALYWLTVNKHSGAFNFASADAIPLRELVTIIESETGKKLILADSPDAENVSPYGIQNDYYMNVEKAANFGFKASPISSYLKDLIRFYAKKKWGPEAP